MRIETVRHSLSHILALAVQELFPNVKFGIGPAIESGFYYDFDLSAVASREGGFTQEDLPKIEKKIHQIIKKNLKFKKKKISIKEVKKLFKKLNQPYKLDILEKGTEEFNPKKEKMATIYQVGEFVDLCRGPHVRSTGEIDPSAFKLTKIAGAYWKGSEKNPMLQRVYGIAFESKKELEKYLWSLEEAERRDHRKLGEDLELFLLDEEVGKGLVLWQPKGAIIRGQIENFWRREHEKRGYHLVFTPHIGKIDLWEKSGHLKFYKENMYPPIEDKEEKYLLKPMNCPFHCQIYKSKIRSYRDLPLRLCELGTVYRYEKEGVLHGLMRVRGLTQDDAHIFCQPEKLVEEIKEVLSLAMFILKIFGFREYKIDLSLRDPTKKEKYLGTDKIWEKAENALIFALKKFKLKYKKAIGEAVFYGPKIDIHLIDSLGRTWQGPTIQIDFNFPERFDLNYIDKKGKKQRVVMVHRTVLGTMERFLGCLLENYGGALPFWLSPYQIWIIPIGKKHLKYAEKINQQLLTHNFRTVLKKERETVSKKIRDGEIQKIPYILVVGDKEIKNKSVRVRERGKGDIGEVKLSKFIKDLQKVSIL